mmetsp:Transcript_32099/g.53980  ORF Transcript_32099/g.53980 Transcript_32099/m.53980 type:complete len:218 (-) Transcript_32099:22-675(-)
MYHYWKSEGSFYHTKVEPLTLKCSTPPASQCVLWSGCSPFRPCPCILFANNVYSSHSQWMCRLSPLVVIMESYPVHRHTLMSSSTIFTAKDRRGPCGSWLRTLSYPRLLSISFCPATGLLPQGSGLKSCAILGASVGMVGCWIWGLDLGSFSRCIGGLGTEELGCRSLAFLHRIPGFNTFKPQFRPPALLSHSASLAFLDAGGGVTHMPARELVDVQ